MPENDRLSGCLDEIDLAFVEREATPRLLMKLSIQLHLSGLSLSNTVLFLEIFSVDRVRSTVHSWVHKADLQPESSRSPNHVAVDETVIRLDDEQYWLYAAVDLESNDLLHTQLEPTTNNRASRLCIRQRVQRDRVDHVRQRRARLDNVGRPRNPLFWHSKRGYDTRQRGR
jgi:transposase-like protein